MLALAISVVIACRAVVTFNAVLETDFIKMNVLQGRPSEGNAQAAMPER
jgi:hypothetical protein